MTNWREYINDPKYLIALLPGLEIARDNLQQEIDSIREAMASREASSEPVITDKPSKTKSSNRAKLLPSVDPDTAATQAEFIALAAIANGNSITNTELLPLMKHKYGIDTFKRISVIVSVAIAKGYVERIATGTVSATKTYLSLIAKENSL